MSKKNKMAKDLRTPKYKPRIVQSKKKKLKLKALRRELKEQLSPFSFLPDEFRNVGLISC